MAGCDNSPLRGTSAQLHEGYPGVHMGENRGPSWRRETRDCCNLPGGAAPELSLREVALVVPC